MAKCTLKLDIDHPTDVPLVPGQTLTGTVTVDVDKDVRCRKLTVDLFWRTHGSGNRATGDLQRVVLFEGEWKAGDHETYPFSLQVPSGPQTYHGHHLNVDWYVNANADIPWAFDPSDEIDLVYDASAEATYRHGPQFRSGFDEGFGAIGSIGQTVIGLMIMGFSSIFLIVGLFALLEGECFGVCFASFPLIFTASGAWLVFTAWRSRIAESLLGEVQVEVPDVLEPGETFDVLVHCVPKRALKLNSLKLALVGQEVVVRGSGTDRTTYRHKVHEEALELDPGRQLKAGEHEVFACSLTLPDDAGPSFAASDNALRWEVALQFDIPRWPDWIKSWQLAVRPRRS